MAGVVGQRDQLERVRKGEAVRWGDLEFQRALVFAVDGTRFPDLSDTKQRIGQHVFCLERVHLPGTVGLVEDRRHIGRDFGGFLRLAENQQLIGLIRAIMKNDVGRWREPFEDMKVFFKKLHGVAPTVLVPEKRAEVADNNDALFVEFSRLLEDRFQKASAKLLRFLHMAGGGGGIRHIEPDLERPRVRGAERLFRQGQVPLIESERFLGLVQLEVGGRQKVLHAEERERFAFQRREAAGGCTGIDQGEERRVRDAVGFVRQELEQDGCQAVRSEVRTPRLVDRFLPV